MEEICKYCGKKYKYLKAHEKTIKYAKEKKEYLKTHSKEKHGKVGSSEKSKSGKKLKKKSKEKEKKKKKSKEKEKKIKKKSKEKEKKKIKKKSKEKEKEKIKKKKAKGKEPIKETIVSFGEKDTPLIIFYDDLTERKIYTKKYFDKLKSKNAKIISEHKGQRKLLLTEIYFLTEYIGKKNFTVVYAGAAPGEHITCILDMFPEFNYVLVDPTKSVIENSKNVIVRRELFTDDTAKEFIDTENVLFISDIRSEIRDIEIYNDLMAQKKWVEIIKPINSMLKFRLPYSHPKLKYFDGTILLQPWAPLTSTETRLITKGKKDRVYKNPEYEEKMFYHNTVLRQDLYMYRQYDNISFDKYLEIIILEIYHKKKYNTVPSNKELNEYRSKFNLCVGDIAKNKLYGY